MSISDVKTFDQDSQSGQSFVSGGAHDKIGPQMPFKSVKIGKRFDKPGRNSQNIDRMKFIKQIRDGDKSPKIKAQRVSLQAKVPTT